MIKRTISLALTAASVAVAAGTMVAQPAHAETDGGATGRVVAPNGLAERSIPSTTGKRLGTLAHGQKFGILCKVHGRSVGGNDLWYALLNDSTWVSAHYVANVGPAPDYCGTIVHAFGKTTAALNLRVAPSTADRSDGRLAAGDQVEVVCQVEGQRIDGNPHWYYLRTGWWISAHYVKGLDRTPNDCT